jgi:hypothetical protein
LTGAASQKAQAAPKSGLQKKYLAWRLPELAVTVIAAMIPGMISMVPVSRSTPVAMRPHPMVIVPSPASTDPDVARHGTNRCDFYDGSRHWRLHDDGRRSRHDGGRRYDNRCWSHHHRGWGYDNRCWKRDSEVDAEMNPSIYRGDSNSGQGQYCDSLFHNVYRLDALDEYNIITTGLPFCNLPLNRNRNLHDGTTGPSSPRPSPPSAGEGYCSWGTITVGLQADRPWAGMWSPIGDLLGFLS